MSGPPPHETEAGSETEPRGQVLISSYNSLGEDRYYDAESQTSFSFDHTTQVRLCALKNTHRVGTGADEPTESIERAVPRSRNPAHRTDVTPPRHTRPPTPPLTQDRSRKSIFKSLSAHAREHYPASTYSVLPTSSDSTLAILLVANKYSPSNYWYPLLVPLNRSLCLTPPPPPQERSLAQHLPLRPLHHDLNRHDQSRRALLRRRQRAPDDLQTCSFHVRVECIRGRAADRRGGEEVPGGAEPGVYAAERGGVQGVAEAVACDEAEGRVGEDRDV